MKSMIWVPDEEHDRQVNQYLDQVNHAPYGVIVGWVFGLFCLFTLIVLIGSF